MLKKYVYAGLTLVIVRVVVNHESRPLQCLLKKKKLQRCKGNAADCLLSLRVTIRGVTLGEVIFWYIFSLYATNSFICTFGVLFMVSDFFSSIYNPISKSQRRIPDSDPKGHIL